jgi:hypothetical protein
MGVSGSDGVAGKEGVPGSEGVAEASLGGEPDAIGGSGRCIDGLPGLPMAPPGPKCQVRKDSGESPAGGRGDGFSGGFAAGYAAGCKDVPGRPPSGPRCHMRWAREESGGGGLPGPPPAAGAAGDAGEVRAPFPGEPAPGAEGRFMG